MFLLIIIHRKSFSSERQPKSACLSYTSVTYILDFTVHQPVDLKTTALVKRHVWNTCQTWTQVWFAKNNILVTGLNYMWDTHVINIHA